MSSVGHLPVWNVVLPLRRAVHGGGAPRVLLLWGEVVVNGGRRRVGAVGGTMGWPGVVRGTSRAVTRGGLPVARGGAVVAVLPRAPALAVGRRLPRLLLLAGVGGRVVQVGWDVVGRCVVGWQVVPAAVLAPRDWVRLLLLPIVRCWAQFLRGKRRGVASQKTTLTNCAREEMRCYRVGRTRSLGARMERQLRCTLRPRLCVSA